MHAKRPALEPPARGGRRRMTVAGRYPNAPVGERCTVLPNAARNHHQRKIKFIRRLCMKGSTKVLEALNEALSEELTAINQYMLHSEMCENWGYGKLSGLIKKHSIDEMKHAEKIIERILFLDGTPNLSKYHKLNIGQTVPAMIQNDLNLELQAVAMYNRLAAIAVEEKDNGTAELFKKLLQDEEGHVDGLEEQLGLIKELGIQNYLVVQTGK
jgi:bacterioferritin